VTDDRAVHLADVAARLWPTPHVATLGADEVAGTVPVGEYLVLPSRRRPRLLVPTGRMASAAVVRHHGEGHNARARLQAGALALGLRAGLGVLIRRDRLHVRAPAGIPGDSLVAHLATVLDRDLLIGMHIGAARANRKPVLQLVSPQGATFAFAKFGVDPLTDSLVDDEARALADPAFAGTSVVQVPKVVHHGSWGGHRLLVQSSLPVWRRRRPLTRERLVAAVRETAGIGGLEQCRLADSPFMAALDARVDRLGDAQGATQLREVVAAIRGSAGDHTLTFGGSHGDWTPWNMASVEDRLLVWDWERFRYGVPLGFDLLHHELQTRLVSEGADPAESARQLLREAARSLQALGIGPEQADATSQLYLADLATRYLTDRQREAGARLGDVGSWLLPALAQAIGERGIHT
jgi:hypothetical protein